jgi:D-tyrosyl-tRNA(Tyr) deacylase
MRAVVQRVTEARVTVDGRTIGEIRTGLVVFLAVGVTDSRLQAEKLANKILQLRIFPDSVGKMNLSVLDLRGSLLIVSQFTLYGDTRKGNRPSYGWAAPPDKARLLYECFIDSCLKSGITVATGEFRAHMEVYLVNDGPVTLLCEAES